MPGAPVPPVRPARPRDEGPEGRHPADLLGQGGLARLRDALRRLEGFDLDAYRPAYLTRRLRIRLHASSVAPEDYPARVAEDAHERRRLIETLGVNVSAFLRDAPVWEYLAETVAPAAAAALAPGETFAAASLGCAAGQEPYGLAMLLAEEARAGGPPFEVDAFDVDQDALEAARRARYREEELRGVSQAARARYFQPAGGETVVVAPELRARVRVRRLDLVTEHFPRRYHLVLCRNVMIYLDASAKERLLRKIHDALVPGGFLVLGQSEVLLGLGARTFQTIHPRHRVYVRTADA